MDTLLESKEPMLNKKLSTPIEVQRLWAMVRDDYFKAYALQNRPFQEFDMLSLLQRMNLDQQTWGAFVGANYSPGDQSWRWQGRKNTARNKIIGILAHVVSAMLYPYVYAYNEDNEEDKLAARVMRVLIENHLKKTKYEDKFLYMMCSALVNPAVFAQVECIEAIQKIKYKKDGKWMTDEVINELLTGIHLNLVPVDQMLLADFYTPDIQDQPYIIRVRRVAYSEALGLYKGKHTYQGKDLFDYIQKGDMTQVVGAGRDNQTIYNIDWTLADQEFVQVITAYYKADDLEVEFVGGVLMGNYDDPVNTNPFKKRRLTTNKQGEYVSMPVYPFAKTGFEPIDPNRRFAYYKSAAFKEFWDDASLNRAYQLAQDSSYLGAFPPSMITGVTNIESSIMVPGYTFGAPKDAQLTPAFEQRNMPSLQFLMQQNENDISLSTQDALQSGVAQQGVTATASVKAEQNAKIIMTVFASMISNLVKDIGQLYVDDIILHTTKGEIDATVPEKLTMKYRSIRETTKENGKDMNNVIHFDPNMELPTWNSQKAEDLEWELYHKNGGNDTHTYTYVVNPYKFAKSRFNVYIDPDVIVSRSLGTDSLRKDRLLNFAMNPAISPYLNMKEVVDKLIIDEMAEGDPDKFKADENQLAQMMMGGGAPGAPATPGMPPLGGQNLPVGA